MSKTIGILRGILLIAALLVTACSLPASPATGNPGWSTSAPNFGANVYIFTPDMPVSTIQATVDQISSMQVSNQFGTQRYALLFEPGTYGSAATPLNFQVGYYTTVAGLGANSLDVVINGSIDVYNQCIAGSCTALENFWRSLSNLTINVTNPTFGCQTGEFWAVSQAAPMRRVAVNGLVTLQDYCTQPAFASGGFIADSQFTASTSSMPDSSSGSPATAILMAGPTASGTRFFPESSARPRSASPQQLAAAGRTPRSLPARSLAKSLTSTSMGTAITASLFRRCSEIPSEPVWAAGPTAGIVTQHRSVLHRATDRQRRPHQCALLLGKNLIFTPGVYNLDRAIIVPYPDTVVLGIGFPTLVPQNGNVSMSRAQPARRAHFRNSL